MLLYKNIIFMINTLIFKVKSLNEMLDNNQFVQSRFYITQLYWDITIQILTSYRENVYYCLLVNLD